jgi:hypothetical protein
LDGEGGTVGQSLLKVDMHVIFDLMLFHQKNPPGHMLKTLKLFRTKVCLRRDILIQSMFYVLHVHICGIILFCQERANPELVPSWFWVQLFGYIHTVVLK